MTQHEVRSPSDVEHELDLELSHLDALTTGGTSDKTRQEITGFDDVARQAAEAEADWKIAEASQLVTFANQTEGRGEAEWKVKARTLAIRKDLYRDYKVKAALKESHLEAIRSSRTRVDAIRTKCANRRGQD